MQSIFSPQLDSLEIETDALADMAVKELRGRLLLPLGRDVRVVVARGTKSGSADVDPVISVVKVGGHSMKRKGWSTGNVLYTPSGGSVVMTSQRCNYSMSSVSKP